MKQLIDFYQVSLKLILKNDQGQVLAMKAAERGSMAGFYDLPGGRIHVDEFEAPFEQILRREAGEEIGEVKFEVGAKPVVVSRHLISARVAHTAEDVHVIYVFYLGRYDSGEIAINDEHLNFEWLDLGQINLAKYFTSGMLIGLRDYLAQAKEN